MKDLFPEFRSKSVRTTAGRIHLLHGGSGGEPILLLHGYPQNHRMWHKVAPQLSREYTVVCPDLRGYGASSKPKGTAGHENYSKRAMALDMVEVMGALGHDTFHVVGHDRGARVAHRLARDHSSRVISLTLLDICPTLQMYEQVDAKFAQSYWHWFFLAQPAPLPEGILRGRADEFVLSRLGRGPAGLKRFSKQALDSYLRSFRDPRTVHATCEEYRASVSIDLVHDRKDRRRLAMPVRVLWARHGIIERQFDCLSDWRQVASDVTGRAVDCGHFIAEERPRELLREIRDFLQARIRAPTRSRRSPGRRLKKEIGE